MPTTPNLVTLIRETKAEIAKLQGILDAARTELDDTSAAAKAPKQKGRPLEPVRAGKRRRRRGRRGSTFWAQEVISQTGPLHANDLVIKIKERFHKTVNKQTLVGNLSRLVKKRDTFYRPAPNTFGLLEEGKEKAG
jgi:hypothetical protein